MKRIESARILYSANILEAKKTLVEKKREMDEALQNVIHGLAVISGVDLSRGVEPFQASFDADTNLDG